tara:strand:- start:625 stop:750 length:126 start_codon:yes stop_codon:yes gene_type:complete
MLHVNDSIVYDEPTISGINGNLSQDDVTKLLQKIESLPNVL